MKKDDKKKPESVVIKKYANRRLYDTGTSSYVTLEDLCQMVKDGADFTVQDATTGEDITRSVLTQIIFEQESKGNNLLPINFLRKIIEFYDDSISSFVPTYLDQMMEQFTANQEKTRGMLGASKDLNPFKNLEQLGKQNMEMFEKTMKQSFSMFNPFMNMGKKDN